MRISAQDCIYNDQIPRNMINSRPKLQRWYGSEFRIPFFLNIFSMKLIDFCQSKDLRYNLSNRYAIILTECSSIFKFIHK